LLEEGRMKRQKMAGEAGLESARMRGQYTYLASLSKQITKIDEDLNDLQIQAQPSVVKALEARREQLIKEAAELQRQLSGAEAPVDLDTLTKVPAA
jgi:capsule polysaccharide export protein KpsE/RkpR